MAGHLTGSGHTNRKCGTLNVKNERLSGNAKFLLDTLEHPQTDQEHPRHFLMGFLQAVWGPVTLL